MVPCMHTHCLLLWPGSVQLSGGSDECLHLLQPPVQHLLLTPEGKGQSLARQRQVCGGSGVEFGSYTHPVTHDSKAVCD